MEPPSAEVPAAQPGSLPGSQPGEQPRPLLHPSRAPLKPSRLLPKPTHDLLRTLGPLPALLHLLLACSLLGSPLLAFGQPPAPARRVLVLYSGDRLLPANVLLDETLRGDLAATAGGSIETCAEFLDEARFPVGAEERTLDLIAAKYGAHPADVLVAVGAPSFEFALRHRSSLLAGVPIVFAGLERGPGTPEDIEGQGITGVWSTYDPAASLEFALRLHPKTRRVYLVASADSSDSRSADLAASIRSISGGPGSTLTVHSLSATPFAELEETLAQLPQNSVVLDLSSSAPSSREPALPPDAAMRIVEASVAPVYGRFDPRLGLGQVGAVATPLDSVGLATAALVRRILDGSVANRLPDPRTLSAVAQVDWRRLRHWGVPSGRLPSATLVRYKPPSFWRQYLLLVVTTSALFVLQSALIVSLVFQSRRRRRAEVEAQRRREELAHMTRVATVGELTASLAHEINQPLAAILSNAQAALLLLGQERPDEKELREILADIVADDRRAGEVIRRMRDLLRKGESSPSNVDVNELVGEVAGLLRAEMLLQSVSLTLELSSRRLFVHGDRIQLQQVLLNLMLNALDAVRGNADTNRRMLVRTSARGEHSVEFAVEDSGPGLEPEKEKSIFDPFYTTKAHGLGLGLAICRSIVQAHGGQIGTRNNAGAGATFWFTLPAGSEARG